MTPRRTRPRHRHEAFDNLTVLLVDDHPVFAEVLARCLFGLADVRSIELAHDLSTARSLVLTTRPDVILLDCHLGPESGLDLVADLERLGSTADVILLSGSSQPFEVADAFARGVRGWVSKRGSVEDIFDAVSAVRSGDKYLSPSIVGPVMDFLVGRAAASRPEPTFLDKLTAREREVLQCLVDGMDRQAVAAQLFVSPNTVRTHVQKLLKSADVHSTVALLAAARLAGVKPTEAERAPHVPRQRTSPR